MERNYYIPNLNEREQSVVNSCGECMIVDLKRGKKEGLLTPIDKTCESLGTYHIDHVGPLTETCKRYNHILVIIDAFSKFVWLYPTKSTGVGEVIDKLEKQSTVFGNPKRIVTDRGAAFTSNVFNEYCTKEGIQHLLIATSVPRGNGQVERVHRTVVPMLSKKCQSKPTQWYNHVAKVQQIFNNTAPRSTKMTPFRILTGLNMRVTDYPDLQEIIRDLEIEELNVERDSIRQSAHENIEKI